MSARVPANTVYEVAFRSDCLPDGPDPDAAVEVVFRGPDGAKRRVPAWWDGELTWRVRYSSPTVGEHRYRSVCADEHLPELDGVEGRLSVVPYEGGNPLYRHGPPRVGAGGRHLGHLDGTPFLWLGDTWWMGFCRRLGWPGEFKALTADRVAKGFSLVQIVAGLYPDMDGFDERSANEAGYSWTEGYGRVNPAYFDQADLRLDWLVHSGLVPCVVGCWGYYLPMAGEDVIRRHWRHLIARWGAYPVVWCLAGEGVMPWYLSTTREQDMAEQRRGWTEVARFVRELDPFGRPITIHPTIFGREQVEDPAVLDFDMLQTGHGDRASLPNTARSVKTAYEREPVMPVVEGEVCYEGIGEACRQEVQRLMFWVTFLSGARGFTYGANGLWQVNRADQPYGPSPHGMSWGGVPWDQALALPGSGQLGLSKRFLEPFAWWRFEPHQEWVEPWAGEDNWMLPYAGGIPGEVRMVFLPSTTSLANLKLCALEPGVTYRARLWSPVDGAEHDLGEAAGDADGCWRPAQQRVPIFQDWLLVLDRR